MTNKNADELYTKNEYIPRMSLFVNYKITKVKLLSAIFTRKKTCRWRHQRKNEKEGFVTEPLKQ